MYNKLICAIAYEAGSKGDTPPPPKKFDRDDKVGQ
jgi:hypothetical protein